MSGDLMIEARGLGRSFRLGNQTVTAVRSVDLAVAEGELVAFLGPNGAGKTTTLRMLTTLLPPTAGTARIAGADIRTEPERARAAIGYVGQKPAAGETYRVRDELVTQGRCHGLDTRRSRQRADELLDLLELTALADRTPATLSGGQRRRADIALGLMHRPRLLFLDEPSTGLDPRSRAHIWEQILRLRAEHGITIFLTTHYLDEAERMAERVIIVDQGRVIADGTARELKSALAGDRIRITTDTAEQAGAAAGIAARFTTPDLVSTDGLALTL